MLGEINRVLSDEGVYIMISYGQPDYRMPYLQKPEYNWDIRIEQVSKPTISTSITIQRDHPDDKDAPNVHFIYICQKKP